jgi:hypothetical protein
VNQSFARTLGDTARALWRILLKNHAIRHQHFGPLPGMTNV